MPKNPAFRLDDFDRFVEENEISEEDWPAAFARWIADVTGDPPLRRLEKVEDSEPE